MTQCAANRTFREAVPTPDMAAPVCTASPISAPRATGAQAKGVIAERRQHDMDQSFTLLRSTARTTNRRLSARGAQLIAAATGDTA